MTQNVKHYGFSQLPRLITRGKEIKGKKVRLSLIEKGLYACLKDICGDDGECYYSLRSLASEIDTSISTLSRYIPVLRDKGVINATKKIRGTAGNKHEIWHISIVNIWLENDAAYGSSSQDCFNEKQNSVSNRNKDTNNLNSVSDRDKIVAARNEDCFYLNDRVITSYNNNLIEEDIEITNNASDTETFVANATPPHNFSNTSSAISEPQADISDFVMGVALQEFLSNRLNPVETRTDDTLQVVYTLPPETLSLYENFSEEELTDEPTQGYVRSSLSEDARPTTVGQDTPPLEPTHEQQMAAFYELDNSVIDSHPVEFSNSEQHNTQPETVVTSAELATVALTADIQANTHAEIESLRIESQTQETPLSTQAVDSMTKQAKETSDATHHDTGSVRPDHLGARGVGTVEDAVQDTPDTLPASVAGVVSSSDGNPDILNDKQESGVSDSQEAATKPVTQQAIIEKPTHPQMPPTDMKWCVEKVVQITEVLRYCDGKQGAYFLAQARGAKGKSQRQRQLDAAKKILAQNVTEEQYVRAYTDRNDEWWNDTKGSLTVEAMAANNKDSVMRILAILEKLESRGSIKRVKNNVTPIRPTNTPPAKQEPAPDKADRVAAAAEVMARLKQQKQAI